MGLWLFFYIIFDAFAHSSKALISVLFLWGETMKCKGFLFDLDGTLVDSLPVVEFAWLQWGRQHGLEDKLILDTIHGRRAIDTIKILLPMATEAEIKQAFDELTMLEVEQSKNIGALPGALALLAQLEQHQIPWAIVTSGTVPIAHTRHKAAKLPMPAAFITGEQVTKSKPDPEGYLMGAAALGLKPEECVVVEDAGVGVAAGINADCQVLAVNVPVGTYDAQGVSKVLYSLEQLQLNKSLSGEITLTFTV